MREQGTTIIKINIHKVKYGGKNYFALSVRCLHMFAKCFINYIYLQLTLCLPNMWCSKICILRHLNIFLHFLLCISFIFFL